VVAPVLADKYGYVPLPRTIDQDGMEHRMASMPVEELSVARSWYRLDRNSSPPRYVLRSLKEIRDPEFYEFTLPILSRKLEGVIFDKRRYPQLMIGQSVTHWETVTGLNLLQLTSTHCSRLFLWSHRQFSDPVPLEADPSALLVLFIRSEVL
jgi:hypothetical protein